MIAKDLKEFMTENGVNKIAVEVVDVNVPATKYGKPKTLAKYLIITEIGWTWNNEAARIDYAMWNSFDKSSSAIPNDFEFVLLNDAKGLDMLQKYEEHTNQLEKEFRDVFEAHHKEIQDKLTEASKLINEAQKISEANGLPFKPKKSIVGYRMSYIPTTFKQKFGDSEDIYELMNELTGAHGNDYGGWQSSQTC